MPKDHNYTRKSDAQRAAAKAGLKPEEFEIITGPKGYSIRKTRQYVPVENAKLHVGAEPEAKVASPIIDGHDANQLIPKTAQAPAEPVPTPVVESNEPPPSMKAEMEAEGLIKSADITEVAPFADKPHPMFSDQEVQDIRDGAFQNNKDEIRRQSTNSRGEPIPRPQRSTIESPTKTVWVIADEMITANPKVPRRDVIATCVNRGIAYFTARTQYQQWLQARRESIEHAAQANKR